MLVAQPVEHRAFYGTAEEDIMSKTRSITFDTIEGICSVSTLATLLDKAGWSFTDPDGRVNIYDINGDDEWGAFNGTYEEFLTSDIRQRLIAIYGSDGQTAELWIENDCCFTIFLSAYIRMVRTDNGEHIDFNRYYEEFLGAFNRDRCIITRVSFEELF